jgi:hypothetical protein
MEIEARNSSPPFPPAGGNVVNTITGTVHNGPVLMGRDFGPITIGGHDDTPGGRGRGRGKAEAKAEQRRLEGADHLDAEGME